MCVRLFYSKYNTRCHSDRSVGGGAFVSANSSVQADFGDTALEVCVAVEDLVPIVTCIKSCKYCLNTTDVFNYKTHVPI